MRYQVPQFVDIEDRIIGPLTLKMFAYYIVAGLLLVPIYVLVDLSLFITLALPTLGVAALFAHVRLQGQPLALVSLHAITFFTSPRIYLWRRGGKPYSMIVSGREYDSYTDESDDLAPSLTVLAQMLDTQGNISAQDATDPMLDDEDLGEAKTPERASSGPKTQLSQPPGTTMPGDQPPVA